MLARLSQGLDEAELSRAHYVTTFFWLGFESGHRQRRLARLSSVRPGYIQYVAENAGHPWLLDTPFFQGWCLGWGFEPEKSDG